MKIRPLIRNLMHSVGLPATRHDLKLAGLKGLHKGKRAIIIGNGPSLKYEDLDSIKNAITFASNRIYLAYPNVKWRPDYHIIQSQRGVFEYSFDILNELRSQLLLASHSLKKGTVPGAIYFNQVIPKSYLNPGFSLNILNGVFAGRTVLYSALQFAFFMGIREVYLLGVDHAYSKPQPDRVFHDVNLYASEGADQNHFSPDYHKPGELWGDPCLNEQEAAFGKAARIFSDHRGKLCNATRGGNLEVLQRVDFDTIKE